ncbi:MAG: hypothetical protein NUV93_08270 [Firmicutes bacterium]|nr:hypothetical protein [Bacillota bacterium]
MKEFIDDLELVGEIEFSYGGKMYSIAYPDSTVLVVEYGKPETEQVFASPEEFVEKFEIDGKRFKEIATDINVLLH